MAHRFKWDLKKAGSNLRKHGVSFEEASTVFGDPLVILTLDPDHSEDESRYLIPGFSNHQRLVVVAFAERAPRTRLISAGRATRLERRRYEEEA